MNRILVLIVLAAAALLPGAAAYGQSCTVGTPCTVTRADGTTINTNTLAMGGSIPSIAYYGTGQVMKNLLYAQNPGFEDLWNQTIWTVTAVSGTSSSSFTTSTFYTGNPTLVTSRWSGATVYLKRYQSGAAGCSDTTGTVTLNSQGGGAYTMTVPMVNVHCPNLQLGDVVVLQKNEINANGSAAGGQLYNGATFNYNRTSPCDGAVSVEANTTAAGNSGVIYSGKTFDTDSADRFVDLNGTYQISICAKVVSGSGAFTVSVQRAGSSACTQNFTATSTFQYLTASCTENEDTSLPAPGAVSYSVTVNAGQDIILDDFSFTKTSGQNPANTSIFRDEYVAGMQKVFANHTGPLRYGPLVQNGCTAAILDSANYFSAEQCNATVDGPGLAYMTLPDYLKLVQVVGAFPYVAFPCAATIPDAVSEYNLIMSYGFTRNHISNCNEAWNGGTMGQNMPAFGGADQYAAYVPVSAAIFKAVRQSSSYNASTTTLLLNNQFQGNAGFMTEVAAVAGSGGAADGAELSPYWGMPFSSNSTVQSFFGLGLSQPYVETENSNALLAGVVANLRSQNVWGPNGNAAPVLDVYEMNDGDRIPCGPQTFTAPATAPEYPACQSSATAQIDATDLQQMNVGAVNGLIAAQSFLELEKLGFTAINLFAFNSWWGPGDAASPTGGGNFAAYQYGSLNCGDAMAALDGAPCRYRPQALGAMVANFAQLGTMVNCTNNAPTYNQAVNAALPQYGPATNNVPYAPSYCFKNGSNYSTVWVNINPAATYTFNFGGTNPPTGAVVSGLQFAPSSFLAINESAATVPTSSVPVNPTNTAALVLSNTTLSYSNPSTITVPPGVTAITYNLAATVPTATPGMNGAAVKGGAISQLEFPRPRYRSPLSLR
jgi:hypothetical protein